MCLVERELEQRKLAVEGPSAPDTNEPGTWEWALPGLRG